MSADDRKVQQQLARRKERVRGLIAEQEARLASIRLAAYLRRENHMGGMSRALDKLHKLKQELSGLEAGRGAREEAVELTQTARRYRGPVSAGVRQ